MSDGNTLSVVVVDDEPLMLRVLTRLLRDLPVSLRVAVDAAEALALLETQPADVLISDFRMPGDDGLTLLEKARARWPNTRLLLHTSDVDAASRAARTGIATALKPGSDKTLLEFVESALAR